MASFCRSAIMAGTRSIVARSKVVSPKSFNAHPTSSPFSSSVSATKSDLRAMASFFRSALMTGTRSIAAKSPRSNLIASPFSSSASENASQASRILSSFGSAESLTPLHRLNSPPRVKSTGFLVKTTPKISVVVRSLDCQNPSDEGRSKAVSCGRTSTPAKMTIALRSYDKLIFEDKFEGKRVRLPETRTVITVNRSPHVHKKSREQFEIRVKKQLMVLQTTEKDEWKRKLFWLKNGRQFLS